MDQDRAGGFWNPSHGRAAEASALSAREVVKHALLRSAALAGAGGLVTFVCVSTLVRGGAAAEGRVALLLVGVVASHFAAAVALHRGFFRDVLALDAARAAGFPDRGALERGFARVANAPQYWALRGFAWFVAGGVNLSIVRHALEPEAFPLAHALLRSMGTVAGGFLFGALLFFQLKQQFAPLREWLAGELGGVGSARRFIRPIALRSKVIVGVTGALAVAALYGTVLAQVRAERTAEATAVHFSQRVLEGLAAGPDAGDLVEQARRVGVLERIVVLDAAADPGLSALEPWLARFEIERIRQGSLPAGDSLGVDSAHHFAWRTLADGRVAVAIAPAAVFRARIPSMSGALGAFLAFVLLATLGVAWLLADDTQRAVRALAGEVERFASGDLRRGRPLVWEDELGGLAARLDHMVASLGAMIVDVRGTADRVEGAAGGVASASSRLLATSREQEQAGEGMRRSLLGVTGQAQGISGSARELTVAVEEGSSSILELRSSGQHLDENATLLHEKVDEVSSSVDELIRSVRDVLSHAEELSGAALETSSSMEQMAASLREVDGNATETARLSQGVVEHAERGREKVRETLSGMEGIREATRAARQVIHGLGDRTKKIGAIVGVIDDVAGETSLLALNAAIIAAQAGENGRAFTVVADEIKKLAERVLASTQEIEALIHGVQEETARAVGAIEAGARVVTEGFAKAEEAGGALEVITGSARDSGARVAEIVVAVAQQSKAASLVVELMERVRQGVEQIRRAGREQDHGNESVLAGSEVMREIARRVRKTTSEQAQGSARIAEGVEAVGAAAERIDASLSEQAGACAAAEQELERMEERTRAHGAVAQELDAAVGRMRQDADRVREAVGRFQV